MTASSYQRFSLVASIKIPILFVLMCLILLFDIIRLLQLQDLLNWLLEKKRTGHFVVGLEQTSSSVPLPKLKFPVDQPIVLLLGKEKEGIPVPLLQAVDQCVEIPQMGIIRSLNVHVSGAICIWEITKQRTLDGK
jgi:tRNA G18 (ribose-2'-O)-methylase SpoU